MARRRRDYATEIPAHLLTGPPVAPPGLDTNRAWLIDQAYRQMQAADKAGDLETYASAEERVNQILDDWNDDGADCE